MNLAAQLLSLSKKNGIAISCAESCTGGMLAAALTDLAGSSAMFDRGFITYTNAAKIELLGVETATIEAYGAVSEEVAAQMATGALDRSDAQIALSITGIAGPGGSEHKPEGRVCFGLATASGTFTQMMEFGALGRDQVRIAARDHAMGLLLDVILKMPIK